MGFNRFNNEGYYDPVPYEAITRVEAEERITFRPVVYICSPFSGDVIGNINKARKYSRFAVDMNAIPIAPHLLFPQFMNEETERELALFMDMVLLGKCAEVWVFGNRISDGMAAEIARAEKRHMIIRYFTEDLREETK